MVGPAGWPRTSGTVYPSRQKAKIVAIFARIYYDGTLIEGMGAGQSKQQLAKPSSSTTSEIAPDSSDSSIKNAEESGGCPMKNADGTYRTMPGFASLFDAKHPPVAGNAAVVAVVPEKRVDPSTSSRPATTAEIDQRSIPAWFVSFSAG